MSDEKTQQRTGTTRVLFWSLATRNFSARVRTHVYTRRPNKAGLTEETFQRQYHPRLILKKGINLACNFL